MRRQRIGPSCAGTTYQLTQQLRRRVLPRLGSGALHGARDEADPLVNPREITLEVPFLISLLPFFLFFFFDAAEEG